MLVESEPDYSLVRVSAESRSRASVLSSYAVRGLLIFVLFLGVVLVLQVASGAYHAEFGGYPDEPAHYITSLMVHDYMAGLKWASPFQFAEQYYHHYPKVAFGHWPPVFYVVQAIWMLVFSTSRTSVRLEIAFTTAVLAYSVYSQCRRWFSGYAAPILAGLLTVCIPLVQLYMDEEMAEILLTVACFWAAVYFGRYLDSERWQDNLSFALFFSLAVLTKGNGWLLAGVVPISLLLTRKLRLMGRWHFWIGPAVVAFLCLPWQILTLGMAEEGWTGGTRASLNYTFSALVQFGRILMDLSGWILGAIAVIGIAVTVIAPAIRGRAGSGPAVMFGLILGTWFFHSLVPAGVEDRKMLIGVPALVLFVFAGGYWLSDHIPFRGHLAHWRGQIVAAAAILAFAFTAFAVPRQWHYGYAEAARFITSQPKFQGDTILAADDSSGEGMLVSEIAMHERRPGRFIVRATKALADMSWNGTRYRSLFSTPEQVDEVIDDRHIDLVVIGTYEGEAKLPHTELLRAALQDTGRFQLIGSFNGTSWHGPGKVLIYSVRHAT